MTAHNTCTASVRPRPRTSRRLRMRDIHVIYADSNSADFAGFKNRLLLKWSQCKHRHSAPSHCIDHRYYLMTSFLHLAITHEAFRINAHVHLIVVILPRCTMYMSKCIIHVHV